MSRTKIGYDADGNLTVGGGRSITWTSYNKPSEISGNGTESFSYGPSRERLTRVDMEPNGDTVTTTYVGDLFEVSYDTNTGVTTYRNTILAGNEQVAVDSFQGGSGTSATETVTYLYTDHLGSVEAVSDGNGANVVQYSYDAWGKARPTSGTGAYVRPAQGSCTTPQCHTGGKLYLLIRTFAQRQDLNHSVWCARPGKPANVRCNT